MIRMNVFVAKKFRIERNKTIKTGNLVWVGEIEESIEEHHF